MPTAQRTRTFAASPGQLWDVVGDPHHLPRWWPRVQRVEAVGEEDFTQVLMSEKGKMVRADFKLLDVVAERRVVWAQQIEGTPFARVLKSAETEIAIAEASASEREGEGDATVVTIELRQSLQGVLARLGGRLVRRAAHSTIEEALDGLERIVGGGSE
jgi:uncharacterized protein YndB with AHSA1/START domain